MFVWTIFTSLIWIVKKLRIETSNTLFACEVFLLLWTFTLFCFFIVYLFERTFWTILNCQIEVCIISWTSCTFFIHQYWGWFRTSPAFILVNMINVIFRTGLTLFCCVVEIIWEITSNASFWSLERKWFWTFTLFLWWVILFIKWTFVTCFCFIVKEIWNRAGNTFGRCLERSLWIT